MPDWIINEIVACCASILYEPSYYEPRHQVVSTIQGHFRLILQEVCSTVQLTSGVGRFRESMAASFRSNGDALLLLDILVVYIRDLAPAKVPYGGKTVDDTEILSYLDQTLSNGSKWAVIFDEDADAGIMERVDGEVLKVAEEINENHLTKAWNLAFQLNSDPEKAVEEAQKAIEIIASNAGLTKATTKVYGSLVGDIMAHPDKYHNSAEEAYNLHDLLNKQQNDINPRFAKWIGDGLDLIQKTHPARHKSTHVKDFVLSPESAQQAIVMATLIGWMIEKRYFHK